MRPPLIVLLNSLYSNSFVVTTFPIAICVCVWGGDSWSLFLRDTVSYPKPKYASNQVLPRQPWPHGDGVLLIDVISHC